MVWSEDEPFGGHLKSLVLTMVGCVFQCKRGEVWRRNNEQLLEDKRDTLMDENIHRNGRYMKVAQV